MEIIAKFSCESDAISNRYECSSKIQYKQIDCLMTKKGNAHHRKLLRISMQGMYKRKNKQAHTKPSSKAPYHYRN